MSTNAVCLDRLSPASDAETVAANRFTGYVEASISTGLPQQPDKPRGGEHPMWLLTSRSPLLTARDSPVGVGWIE